MPSNQLHLHAGKVVTVAGWLVTMRRAVTKNQEYMKFMTIEDRFGTMEVTLFPDTLILVRYSTVLIERQEPVSPCKTVIQFRAGGKSSDSAEVANIRKRHWYYYWDDKKGNLLEDVSAYESQQRAMRNAAVRYSLIARGEPGHTGLRGDDNRLRWFWENWRKHMDMDYNGPVNPAVEPGGSGGEGASAT